MERQTSEVIKDHLRRIKFITKRLLNGIEVPDAPHFDSAETTAWFTDQLKNSRMYLEFGSGGSTYLAAQYGIPFVTTESDRGFLKAVEAKIQRDGYFDIQQTYRYVDIGPTGNWGTPLGRVSELRLRKFRHYSDLPSSLPCPPDLVLIDGRFRVACALKTMLRFPNATVVLDDYTERPHYRELENFANVETIGRMAILRIRSSIPHEIVEKWETDWR